MSEYEPLSLMECIESLPDPRMDKKCDHLLIDIMVITVCAAICDAEGWTDVETFGKSKQDWLATFLSLPHGIPSHDTFGRVFAVLDAEAFEQAFIRWVESVFKITKGQVIALDGKTLRRSHDKTIGKNAIHMVSAWAKESGLEPMDRIHRNKDSQDRHKRQLNLSSSTSVKEVTFLVSKQG
jgi:hypothetical protein